MPTLKIAEENGWHAIWCEIRNASFSAGAADLRGNVQFDEESIALCRSKTLSEEQAQIRTEQHLHSTSLQCHKLEEAGQNVSSKC